MSRNQIKDINDGKEYVTSREGRVSRNKHNGDDDGRKSVTSREGRVSRNVFFAQCRECVPASRPARDV